MSVFQEYFILLLSSCCPTQIFGGVGFACLPLGLIFSFFRRPKVVITRSQYIKEATELGKKARELKKAADALRQEEKSGSKGRKWRKNVKAVEKELLLLEEDVKALEEMLIVSVAWIAHIVIYLLINPPLSPFLNGVFIKLDDVWGLLGTAAFAFFCFYLLLAVIAGAMMLGMRLVFITIHPESKFSLWSMNNQEKFYVLTGEEKTNVAPNGELETEAKVVNIPSSCSMEFDAQTMNDLPEVEVIPPEEVSAVACDDKPDRLEMAQLYNEMCKVLGQNANESMEAFLANKPAGAECWQLQEQGEKVGKQQIGSHNESNLVQVEEESPSTRDHLSRYKQNPLSSSVGFF
ncbi:hypothetical protein TEA_020517 [Camellia sinensis var. sinensis]|uniref:Uncharacterized protein n=2 Tax=Camellia sinensis TaxID=4442 RepID=A0A4S4EWI6_CAMSN|nr:hypothetical protein TEA_020517 [Camellia sinensis var. sinensis]